MMDGGGGEEEEKKVVITCSAPGFSIIDPARDGAPVSPQIVV